MGQDLDQILLLIGGILAGGFFLILLLARLEPPRMTAPAPVLLTTPAPGPAPVVDQVA